MSQYRYGKAGYGSSFKEAFKRDELAYELRHEDKAMGVSNPYNYDNVPEGQEDQVDTFDGWKLQGRFLRKGQKAKYRRNGVPVFHISQTYQRKAK